MSAAGLRVLEVASGTGEHCAHFVGGMPHVAHWQPTEFSGCAGPHLGAHQDLRDICESITAFTESLPNVAAPRELDASAAGWNWSWLHQGSPAANSTPDCTRWNRDVAAVGWRGMWGR